LYRPDGFFKDGTKTLIMAPPISKELILDAAESVVREVGATHMTLEAVAERAGISKGGLLYNFPNKDALLQAMINRMMEALEAARGRAREHLGNKDADELTVEIQMLADLDAAESCRGATFLAVMANQPDLMIPFHESISQRCSKDLLVSECSHQAAVVYLAAMGMHLAKLLSIPLLTAERRAKIYSDLLDQAKQMREN